MLLKSDAKRLAIFAYYDADGVVDDYVLYLLRAVNAMCARQIVMVNGTLTPQAEARVRACCTDLVFRPNTGYDITAYKEAFLALKQDELDEFDEILFYNQTIFGPVYPLEEMFGAMAEKDVDFWGLTRHKGAHAASWDDKVAILPHVQSFFFAVRSTMFRDASFAHYWHTLPAIETYWDAVSKHEVLFTKHFADAGFVWDTYIQTEELEKFNDYPLMGMPAGLLKVRRCPFFKRKSFLCNRYEYTNVPQGEAPQALYDFVRTQTKYPIELVLQNILRTADIATVTSALTLYYDTSSTARIISGVAMVVWFKSDALAESLCRAAGMQRNAKLYCLFANEALAERYKAQLPAGAQCIVTEQNGAQYLFKTLWKELVKYTYVGYLHNDLPLLLGEFFDATTLGTAVESLAGPGAAALLVQHPEIGMLIPPLQMHQENYYCGLNWPMVAPTVKDALAKAGVRVPLGETKPGLASRGGMFFARMEAVRPLAAYPFEEKTFAGDYPAWEFLPPLAAQSRSLLTVFACSNATACTLLANQSAYLADINSIWATPNWRSYDRVSFRMRAINDFYKERRFQMTLEQAFAADLTFKQKMWICLQLLMGQKNFAFWRRVLHRPEHIAPQTDEFD